MFLNRLTVKEKIAFLELAHHVAWSDSNFSEFKSPCMKILIRL